MGLTRLISPVLSNGTVSQRLPSWVSRDATTLVCHKASRLLRVASRSARMICFFFLFGMNAECIRKIVFQCSQHGLTCVIAVRNERRISQCRLLPLFKECMECFFRNRLSQSALKLFGY